jgi:ribosomal protein L31E
MSAEELDVQAEQHSGNGQISVEEAAAVLADERQQRAGRALQEIRAVLAKHDCRLEAQVILRAGQVIPQVEVVANE